MPLPKKLPGSAGPDRHSIQLRAPSATRSSMPFALSPNPRSGAQDDLAIRFLASGNHSDARNGWLGDDHAWDVSNDVEFERGVCSRRQVEAANVWMKFQELLRRRCGYEVGPRPVDLLDDVEGAILNRVETHRLELHALEHIERIAQLGGDPVVGTLRGVADGGDETIGVVDGSDVETRRRRGLSRRPRRLS